jgi:hypothetical protein
LGVGVRIAPLPAIDSDPESFLQEGGCSAFAGVEVPGQNLPMATSTEFFHWYIVDERTGKRGLTTYKLTRKDAELAFPGAEPDLQTREIRHLSDPGDAPLNSRPGEEWVS